MGNFNDLQDHGSQAYNSLESGTKAEGQRGEGVSRIMVTSGPAAIICHGIVGNANIR